MYKLYTKAGIFYKRGKWSNWEQSQIYKAWHNKKSLSFPSDLKLMEQS